MSHNRPPLPVIIVVLLTILGTAGYFGWQQIQPQTESGALTASGTVEAVEIAIAPELSGKVLEVLVDEGDSVQAGDVLFRLDSTLLEAQKSVATASLDTAKSAAATAESAVASAQAQYDQVYSAALVQDRTNRSTDWYKTQSGDYTLPLWYYNQAEQISAAQKAVESAQAALEKAQRDLEKEIKTSGAEFVQAESALGLAQAEFQVAKNLNERIENAKDIDDLTRRQLFLLQRDAALEEKDVEARWVTQTNRVHKELRDAAQQNYDDAKEALENAQDDYEEALSSEEAKAVLKARAEVSIAEERLYTALDFVRVLQTGSEAQTVTAARKALEQAKAAASQAQTAIRQAEANITLLNTQLAKLTVTAPADGVVLSRNIQPGEMSSPGSVVITLGKLNDLTITVYVAEDRYGEISLGQPADVTVDSFPGATFSATVVHIADRAEFTPRNVQTADGRKTTVFAIKLKLQDPEGKLKPGMPADVMFK